MYLRADTPRPALLSALLSYDRILQWAENTPFLRPSTAKVPRASFWRPRVRNRIGCGCFLNFQEKTDAVYATRPGKTGAGGTAGGRTAAEGARGRVSGEA